MPSPHPSALADVCAGLLAAAVGPVWLTGVGLVLQAQAPTDLSGIAGLATSFASTGVLGWYLWYQSSVAEPRREKERSEMIVALTQQHAAILTQTQRDNATLIAGLQERYERIRTDQQAESDRLLEALLRQVEVLLRQARCPAGHPDCPLHEQTE